MCIRTAESKWVESRWAKSARYSVSSDINFNQNLCRFSWMLSVHWNEDDAIVTEIQNDGKITKWETAVCILLTFSPNTQTYKRSLYTRIASAGTFHFNVVHITSRIQLTERSICHLIFWALYENDSTERAEKKLCKWNSRWTLSVSVLL